MKVVFIEDVPDVALAGETREVADGYGRNYLLPKKLAVLANSAASNIVQARMKQVLIKRAQAESEMKEIAAKLDGTEVAIKAKAGEKERLYGSVTGADIATEIESATGLVVDKRKIELEEPIRQLGVHDITIKFTHDITAAIKLTVEAEAVAEEKEETEKKPRAKKAAKDEATAGEEAVGEAETAGAEATEVKAQETAMAGEEATTEVKKEEAEVAAPEAEDKAEEPKAKKKSKKKTEAETEE